MCIVRLQSWELINYCAIPIILAAEFYDNFTAKLQIGNKAPLFHSKSLGKKVVSDGK